MNGRITGGDKLEVAFEISFDGAFVLVEGEEEFGSDGVPNGGAVVVFEKPSGGFLRIMECVFTCEFEASWAL